ncbi:M20/M25/M40 family metallo-hydrolase [Ancylomarina euxinus]|uniref:M20/M25/M40 family metallo-hydrolase n=1 Tax=Ancylomarina euxinus TaxID=2283627 RepID=A0A425Y2I8_9BACT|nr:M20 family metallo-hydrolase [Ancylomarina euxinus]MCZ4694918.1 M20 family metallo-hydrolase [Ancylomarina euxinus]MUP14784.1 M20/M25/M40 family metallo-hydrolase [Ancylomarina euxinus]RRG22225.1 M20/M25/M40 family metallo-hydrolase [Ancylomarina euxinus]
MKNLEIYKALAIETLKGLIAIQSYSKEENLAADLMEQVLQSYQYQTHRKGNNVWVYGKHNAEDKALLLLNSHLDTVNASASWTKDPFQPLVEDGKLYGLGSNDAGGCLCSLMATFLALDEKEQDYNLVFAASAEEEISGKNGFELIQKEIGKIDLGIVGEPTLMQMAIAEKGLMVLDVETKGVSGHAARGEGVNAIDKAMKDLQWFQTYKFDKESEILGPVKMTVTQIAAGSQHNVVPDSCRFVVDVRSNEHYSNQDLFELIDQQIESDVKARSFRMNSSGINLNHPLVQAGIKMGRSYYGSPTTSDQAIMKGFPTLKFGPGDSARSHTANEFIYLFEIEEGVEIYYQLLNGLEIQG